MFSFISRLMEEQLFNAMPNPHPQHSAPQVCEIYLTVSIGTLLLRAAT